MSSIVHDSIRNYNWSPHSSATVCYCSINLVQLHTCASLFTHGRTYSTSNILTFLQLLCHPKVSAPKSRAVLTWVGLSTAVWACRWGSIPCLYFKSISTLLLTIKHNLGEHFTRLQVDLKVVFTLISGRVYYIVVYLWTQQRYEWFGRHTSSVPPLL